MNESLLERSTVISTPSIVCEETIINTIFKLLSRADTAVSNLSETLKQESKLRTDIKVNNNLRIYLLIIIEKN